MEIINNKISQEHEKIIQEFKYLIPLDPKQVKEQLLQLLNKLQPFLQYPLDNPPPLQFYQTDMEQQKTITEDLKTDLSSYCFIVLRGSLIISKQNFYFTQQKYLSQQNIRQKSVYNFDDGKSKMRASKNSVYLKIHNIWIKKAKKKYYEKQRQYIRSKLIDLNFFSQLTFEEFDQCCKKAYIQKLGPQQTLIKQLQTPYNMYIVAEGELCLQKRLKFSKQQDVWNQVKSQMKKNNQFCQQLFQYLVRQPKQSGPYFQVDFNLKQIHQGQILCAKQTLMEIPLQYTIKSSLKTKIICIKYPDLYVLKQQRLAEIRNWQFLFQIDKKKLRRQYYQMMKWNEFKQFLNQQNFLSKLQKSGFNSYLRKDVDLNSKRYNFTSKKVNQGRIIDSPAGTILKMKSLVKSDQKNMFQQ